MCTTYVRPTPRLRCTTGFPSTAFGSTGVLVAAFASFAAFGSGAKSGWEFSGSPCELFDKKTHNLDFLVMFNENK